MCPHLFFLIAPIFTCIPPSPFFITLYSPNTHLVTFELRHTQMKPHTYAISPSPIHLLCFANLITYMNAPPSPPLNPRQPQCSSQDLFCLACCSHTAHCLHCRSSLSLPVRRPPTWEFHQKHARTNPETHV